MNTNHGELAQAFESSIVELFSVLGYEDVKQEVSYHGSLGHKYRIDAIFGKKGDATVVEIKKYRPNSPPNIELINKAFWQINLIREDSGAKHCLLVISCHITPSIRELSKKYPNVTVWTLSDILEKSKQFPKIHKKILSILEIDFDSSSNSNETSDSFIGVGSQLFENLKKIPTGRENAYAFEDACIEALKYLFEHDLIGWHEQNETTDGLQRRDLICRIRQTAEVWQFISNDLGSRYIIFEFKNYSSKITQKEIITTERYLYPTALRKTAIILSPEGCSDSANLVIQGAMREHGKLIISLSIDEIGKWLIEKDGGGDPNTYLFDVVDSFLMRLGR